MCVLKAWRRATATIRRFPHDEQRKAFTKAGSIRQVVFKVKGAAVYQFLAGFIDGDGNIPVGV